MLKQFRGMLQARFEIARQRFPGFRRQQMATEYLDLLDRYAIFDGHFLPASGLEFLTTAYCRDIPFHGLCHIAPMLLHLMHDRKSIGIHCAVLGHDAGHNGVAADSQETLSATLTSYWMTTEEEWFRNQGMILTGDSTKRMIIEPILATQFPYGTVEVSTDGRAVRWMDTMRIATGASTDILNRLINPRIKLTRFRTFLLESLGFNNELAPEGTDPRDNLLTWLENGQLGFFFPQLLDGCGEQDHFPHWQKADDLKALRENIVHLMGLLATDAGRELLLGLYDAFCENIPIGEFTEACEQYQIP